MLIVLGAVIGVAVGALNHMLLRRALSASSGAGQVGRLRIVFWLRYTALALALLLFWLCARSGPGAIALALAALGASRLLLLWTFHSGGDRS